MHTVLLTNGNSFKVDSLSPIHITNLKECTIVENVIITKKNRHD